MSTFGKAPEQVVWKFPLELRTKPQPIQVPLGARIAHAAWFQGRPTLWYLVEVGRPITERFVQIAATGQEMPPYNEAIHQRTVIQDDTFVWHVFELVGDPQ